MPEALARTQHDFKLSRRVRQPARRRGGLVSGLTRPVGRFLLRQFSTRPATTIAGAAFAALMTGILLNGLVLQTVHHPIGPRRTIPPAQAMRSAPPPPVAPAVVPPARPVDLGATGAARPAGATASTDPIAQLLKNGAAPHASEATHKSAAPRDAAAADEIARWLKSGVSQAGGSGESEKNVLAAQRALIKLGYNARATGVFGALTRQAIERFERDHGMAAKGELTPRVAREIARAASAAAD